MAYKVEKIRAFLGFGEGERAGEYYFSSGMRHNRGGIEPGWEIVEHAKSSTVSGGVDAIKWFDERAEAAGVYIYGIDENGAILKAQTGSTWSRAHTPGTSGQGNGLIVDHSGSQRVLYAQNRYLGSYDGIVWYDSVFKDFGTPTVAIRPSDIYEDWVVFGNGTTVAMLNITDDSWNAAAFTLPNKFSINALKSGKNGILIGANFNNKGVLILWDGQVDRAIAPWIWTEGKIHGIAKYKGIWLVSTGREILLTNGYDVIKSYNPPDLLDSTACFGPFYPSGMVVEEDRLLIASSQGLFNRAKKGVFALDLLTGLWEFMPLSTQNLYTSAIIYALFITSDNWRYVSYTDNLLSPNQEYIGTIYDSAGTSYFISGIAGGRNNVKKRAEAIIIDFDFISRDYKVYNDPNWKFTLKLYDFSRQLWSYAQTKVAGAVTTQVTVDDTVGVFNRAEVGDEVTILEGLNGGDVRHITAISGSGTATEVWTLDTPLHNLTEAYIMMSVIPFKKVGTKIISGSALIKDNRFYIPIKNSIIGRKFLIKVMIEATYMRPHISDLTLIYNELDVF